VLKFTFYGERDPKLQLLEFLRDKRLLLLLDNFEHLLDGAGLLPDILDSGPHVKMLLTSRERLNLREEWVYDVRGLAFPENGQNVLVDNYTAVQLFVQTTRRAGYKPADPDTVSIVRICRIVEGIPLAIELAASWVRIMPCAEIAREVERSLDILTTTTRNIPEKHRSMRAAFERSWDLLTGEEQAVFSKLSVFRGGFTREASEQVTGGTLTILASLVDKSLVQVDTTGRYDLHELLRQYAADKLLDADEENSTVDRYCHYFLWLAETADAHGFGREQVIWYDRLETEMDNLRAVFSRLVGDETGLRLAGALGWFFNERNHWNEGLNWLEKALAANPNASASLRTKALHNAGSLAGHPGYEGRIHASLEHALTLARATNDRWSIAWSLSHMALYGVSWSEELDLAASLLEESLALFRELDDAMGLAHALIRRSWIARNKGDYAYARALAEEAENLAREAGDQIIMGWAFLELGHLSHHRDDLAQARTHYKSSLFPFNEARFLNGYIRALFWLADVEQSLGNTARVQTLMEEARSLLREIGLDNAFLSMILGILSDFARFHGRLERAVTLMGAANSSNLVQHAKRSAAEIGSDGRIEGLRNQLGETAFAEAWAVGNTMTRERAIAYALDTSTTPDGLETAQPAYQSLAEPLNQRELEILHLIADGLSNREIAARMFLTVNTVKWYLKSIFGKLHVANRTEAVTHARGLGLLV
jgi:predicted ATPase/DNA-binding CsgD family transcriptional regulator